MLSNNLTAYRKYQNCETSLIRLIERWKQAVDNRNVVGVLSTDMSKAFDSLYPPLLTNKLKAYGFSNNSLTLMRSYFTNKKNKVRISQKTTSNWISSNCFQSRRQPTRRKAFWLRKETTFLTGIATIFCKEVFLSIKWWVWARGIVTRIYIYRH